MNEKSAVGHKNAVFVCVWCVCYYRDNIQRGKLEI